MEDLRTLVVWYAKKWLLIPYSWAGQNPLEGVDCSGFIIKILQSWGILPIPFDDTAHGLFLRFKKHPVQKPQAGVLVFWFEKEGALHKASHVEMCINNGFIIGASGGGSQTLTLADAIRQDAFIDIKPIDYRGNDFLLFDPFLEGL